MKKYSGLSSLEKQISIIARKIPGKTKKNYLTIYNIAKNWNNIVGTKYAKYCYPKKITTNQFRQSTLFICAYNSAAAFALDANQNNIIEKIACYFGYKMIDKIRVSQELQEIEYQPLRKPLEKETLAQIKKITSEIKDINLRKSLEELGKDIFSEKLD